MSNAPVVFIIGAGSGSGIGHETALTFAERGASAVICADINTDTAKFTAAETEKLAAAKDFKTLACHVNVTERASVEAAMKNAIEGFGRIDHLVNCAGLAPPTLHRLTEYPADIFTKLHTVNTHGTLTVIQVAAALMSTQPDHFSEGRHRRRSLGRGAITTVVSLAGHKATPGYVSYGASKAAALSVVRTAAVELAGQGVRVNAVSPSFVETPMLEKFEIKEEREAYWEKRRKALPLQRFALPEEVAGVIHFLGTPDASYINGADIEVDSGQSSVTG